MVRGIENILRGRDPRDAWAFTQRICGVCTLVHGIASVRAVEDAVARSVANPAAFQIPADAQLIRNLMIGAQYVHDHVMHFYHLHALDWVDIVSALQADPAKTADFAQCISTWPNSSAQYFGQVKTTLADFVAAGQLGIFTNGYWGHPEYKLPPEVNLLAFAHYLEALAWQRDVAKVHAIFGGKNPHPNFLVGGSPCAVSSQPGNTAVDSAGLALVSGLIDKMRDFVDRVYLPDLVAIASFYKEWAGRGEGLGNFLTYGDFPGTTASDLGSLFIPRGAILNRDLTMVYDVDLNDPGQVQEYVDHSWYSYSADPVKGPARHPYEGETTPQYTGPNQAYQTLKDPVANDYLKYSWLKSPRWRGHPMEVGPLARVLMLYAKPALSPAQQAVQQKTRELVDGVLAELKLPLNALFSTLGRTAARGIETKLIADQMTAWQTALLDNIARGNVDTHNPAIFDPANWPATLAGAGYTEAPRGALAHWVVIQNGRIANYQAVVPSTWNAGPRDASDQEGPYEAALVGHSLHDPTQPLEILRTIHSFDPCLACAVHVVDPAGRELVQVKVV
jgi:hydrogenase large subunit